MLSPNPISLLCAIILSLPFALLFTISDHSTTITTITNTAPITTVTAVVDSHNVVSFPTLTTDKQPLSYSHHRQRFLNITQTIKTNRATWATLEADDDRLLREASRVSTARPSRPPKVAFMFQTTTPLHFAPLWDRFFLQAPPHLFTVYVHADPTYNYTTPFTGVFSGRVIPSSKSTRRNTPSLALAARRLLAHALVDDPANSMFALLSPACIPLRSFNFIYNFLVHSGHSFLELLKNETTAKDRYMARGEHVMLPEVRFTEFRIGSQFWVLSRTHARVVARDRILWGKFGLPCVDVGACYPEENYFPTLVSMVDPRGVVPATLTHVDWSGRTDGHPRAYNGSEVGGELIGRLRRDRPRYGDVGVRVGVERWDPFLFARKFEPECLQPLMRIADDVIFGDER